MPSKDPKQPIIQLVIEDGRWAITMLDLTSFWCLEKEAPTTALRLRQAANVIEREAAKALGGEEYERALRAQIAEARARCDALIRVHTRAGEKTEYRAELEHVAKLFGEAGEFAEEVAATRESRRPGKTTPKPPAQPSETTAQRRARLRKRKP